MPIFKADKRKEIPPLLHAPLVETIFEVRWELAQVEGKPPVLRDAAYPMLYGRLYDRLQKEFPIVEDLPSTAAHPDATPYVPRHRMRKTENGYPLIQVGPGIVTVNDIKGRSWTAFSELASNVIEAIVELYPKQGLPLNFIRAELRYLNAIRFDLAKEHPLSFLEEKLHTKLAMDPALFEDNLLHERPNSVGLNLSYALEKPTGNLSLALNLGQFEGKPAYIQQTVIQSFGEMVPADSAGFDDWLKDAQEVARHCFKTLCKGDLMAKFGGA